MRVEIIALPGMIRRARTMIEALARACPLPRRILREPTGAADLLVMYGLGEPVRRQAWLAHVASGRHGIGVDLGYWDRDRKMRFTLNADHPQQFVRPMPGDRMQGITLRNDWSPDGHIVLVGLGRKQVPKTGEPYQWWETERAASIAAAYPGRRIVYRPKKDPAATLYGCTVDGARPIEAVLRGASLVVCRHSNVAVDAAIAGIPVVCEDGIGAALYGSDLMAPRQPTHGEREEFLRSVSYWQWTPNEADRCWQFLTGEIARANQRRLRAQGSTGLDQLRHSGSVGSGLGLRCATDSAA